MSSTELSLHEQLVLLALEPSSLPGPFKSKSKYVDIGVAGAILLLLVRGGRVTFQRGSFHVRGQLAVGDSEVDELLKDLESKADPFRAQSIGRWLRRAARAKPQDAAISGLVSRKVLARKNGKLFLLQSEAREEVLQRVRQAIRGEERANQDTAALASLAHAAMCLSKREFSNELKRHRKQLNALGEQTGPVIPAVRAAVSDRKFKASLLQVLGALFGILVTLALRYCSS